jgi:hypothetical protein
MSAKLSVPMAMGNVIKLSSCYSREDVKTQSVEPFSLRLCVFARVRFRESLARNPLTLMTLSYGDCGILCVPCG